MNDTWDKLESIKRFSRWSAWCAIILAFIAAAASLVEVIADATNVSSIVIAFLSGIAGLSAKVADRRKQTLENAYMRTKPEMDVYIATHTPTDRLLVVVEPRNMVPFEFDWKIVTKNNIIVSGIHLRWGKIVPSDQTPRFTTPATFDANRVIDDYIELRFDFRSVYANELLEANLSGKLKSAYRLTSDRKHCIPVRLQT